MTLTPRSLTPTWKNGAVVVRFKLIRLPLVYSTVERDGPGRPRTQHRFAQMKTGNEDEDDETNLGTAGR